LQREFRSAFCVGFYEAKPDWLDASRLIEDKPDCLLAHSTARQPGPSFSNSDLIGYRESSDVASTRAKTLTSNQHNFYFASSRSEFGGVFFICLQFADAIFGRSWAKARARTAVSE
jgi:hypothetical protein